MPSFVVKKKLVAIRYQWQLFCLALMFFTRLPVSKKLPYSSKRMNEANRYFSLVGIVIGCIVVISYCLFEYFLPQNIAILLTMVISVLLTGAFHEDGLADMADGIGGGYTVEKRLAIMKDSRIGTYGTVSLILTFMLKFYLLVELAQHGVFIIAVIVAYSLSRAFAASLIIDTSYVTDEGQSKSKPLAAKQSKNELYLLMGIGLFPSLALPWIISDALELLLSLLLVLLVLRFAFRRWIIARIGGFTGDCLGAAQQFNELLIYLVIVQHVFNGGEL